MIGALIVAGILGFALGQQPWLGLRAGRPWIEIEVPADRVEWMVWALYTAICITVVASLILIPAWMGWTQ